MGADERLFSNIHTAGCNRHYIRWHSPSGEETLSSYVQEVKRQLEHFQSPILVGVSLGGIIAMELREVMPVQKTILVSSVKTREEMPAYFHWVRALRMNEWMPPSFMKNSTPFIKPFISGTSDEATFRLFKAMLHDTDENFMGWSIRQVLHWNRISYTPGNLVHIHGTNDFVFPIGNLRSCDYRITGGAHDMILSSPVEISEILTREIAKV